MANIPQIVGQNIKLFRNARSITQERLAEMVNVSGSYIGYLERGKKSPSLDFLAKIAHELLVDPAILLTSNDELKNKELKKLIGILSDKETESVKFMNEIAIAYFKSLERFQQ